MANIDNVQLPDGSSYNIVDNTSGFVTQNYVDSAVASVTKTTIGLGNVDNTSDLNKPISTATQTALDTLDEDKADKTDIAPVESSSTASQTYQIGEQFYYNGLLYKATAVINSGGTITPNGNCSLADSLTEQIKRPNSELVSVSSTVGTIGNRTICRYGKLRSLCVELTLTQAITANSALFSIASSELYPIAISCGEVIDLSNGVVSPVHLNTSGVCVKSAVPSGDASIASGHTIVITISYMS